MTVSTVEFRNQPIKLSVINLNLRIVKTSEALSLYVTRRVRSGLALTVILHSKY